MSKDVVDKTRRRLLVATSVVGGVGVAFAAVPFLASMAPSARTKSAGAPVEVDISKLEPGELMTVKWRGKPVWIVNRTAQNQEDLPKNDPRLQDPKSDVESQQPPYARNGFRSLKPEYLVVVGICTHLGCSPTYRPEMAPEDLGSEWRGGFFCPCHGSRFDLAGRVFKGVPAPTNLVVPSYTYLDQHRVLVGQDPSEAKFKALSDAGDGDRNEGVA